MPKSSAWTTFAAQKRGYVGTYIVRHIIEKVGNHEFRGFRHRRAFFKPVLRAVTVVEQYAYHIAYIVRGYAHSAQIHTAQKRRERA